LLRAWRVSTFKIKPEKSGGRRRMKISLGSELDHGIPYACMESS
jgi:hypothetical protein